MGRLWLCITSPSTLSITIPQPKLAISSVDVRALAFEVLLGNSLDYPSLVPFFVV